MIHIYDAKKRIMQQVDGVKIFSIFSCNTYFDPGNTHFSSLIVLNEYLVQPGKGFNMHPHEEVEQLFLILEGEISHGDTLGAQSCLGVGSVQAITTGSGYARYAVNKGPGPCRYISAWFLPSARRLQPRQTAHLYAEDTFADILMPLASGMPEVRREYAALPINCRATVYRSILRGPELALPLCPEEHAVLYVIDGSLTLNGRNLSKGGHARIAGEDDLILRTREGADIVFIAMQHVACGT